MDANDGKTDLVPVNPFNSSRPGVSGCNLPCRTRDFEIAIVRASVAVPRTSSTLITLV